MYLGAVQHVLIKKKKESERRHAGPQSIKVTCVSNVLNHMDLPALFHTLASRLLILYRRRLPANHFQGRHSSLD